MKKFIVLLIVVILMPCKVLGIDIRKEGTSHQGGMRMPSLTRVSADYTHGILALRVAGYTGGIQVYVNDVHGDVVGYTISSVIGSGDFAMNLGTLSEGSYALTIVLDNATYYGQFEL